MATQKDRRTAPRKPAGRDASARAQVSPDEIKRLIAEAAYYRAKERGFKPGQELEDWVQAEAEVRLRLGVH